MPPIIRATDQDVCVATSEYPYAKWKFEKFNPVQSRVLDFYDQDMNGLVAASTSAGKTVVSEILLAEEIRKRGGKGMFLAPLRALAREKLSDWTSPEHHFSDLKISICTGDFRLTKERSKELEEADLIIMTSEMLNHRSRNFKSEQNNWIKSVGTLVIDESHLLTVPNRGDHLEVGLMKFTKINPKARLVLLSATMPNVEQIAEWISYTLTKKETFVLNSKYRPVPLTIHYEPYCDDFKNYDLLEKEKVNKALDIVEWYTEDKFLIFAHTKRTGEMMKKELSKIGVEAEFHNADLESKKRIEVEDRFRNDPKLRVIVATSTLAWGLNLPARRVIILGVNRGIYEVETHDIIQMVGRSGRLGIDPMGDAYILVPESLAAEYRKKLSKPTKIESQLLVDVGGKYKTLAFHLISEIHHKDVITTEDVHDWYKRSLGYFQNKSLDDSIVDQTLSSLQKCGAVWHENDEWTARPIGAIASMFYFSPYDVSDLYFNFKNLFESHLEKEDYHLAMALANTDSARCGIVSKFEKEEISSFSNRVKTMCGNKFSDPVLKNGFCYYNLLNGNPSTACSSLQRNLQLDFNRISQVLQATDKLAGKWGMSKYFKNLEGRILHGVPEHLLSLCRLPNIGKVRAQKLYNLGIKSVKDVLNLDPEKLRSIINMKKDTVAQIIDEAKKLQD